ncbi:crossover junction endodeoxyribonuclease RuvC [Aquiflexum sp. TKW24L]|uniref:crossover junction endodeoxyribonuclease RuvC n=1 Tax=Aquiflexum sp. TKW24L TaxID=2942212 RepID=UPI0020BE5FE4|nr:crossover junction endodeoxyribonuclease RuvC [Aquiflexum sp. TKW24L]MCL6261645.1 crossover junction endodeoxyribonuclease RuvC [Aquiflexum sp. TKW24L]
MSKEDKKEAKEKIILGIDPGTNVMGYGLILIEGKKYSVLQFGVIHLKKYVGHELKLKKIFERVTGIIDEFHPDTVALEAPFYGENVQSMLKLGRAQGVAMAAALARDIPITEYSPKKVKQSVTGNGNASKIQVAEMLKTLLNIEEIPKLLDATDALAVALCHHFHDGRLQTRGRTAGWKSFLEDNPNRVKSQ